MASGFCVCCTEFGPDIAPRLTKLMTMQGEIIDRAHLCDDCAKANHRRWRCDVMVEGKKCGEFAWHCAMVHHMGTMHPDLLLKYERVKTEADIEIAKLKSKVRNIGTLYIP